MPGKPLSGTRVIEFAQLAPGPYAGLVLAELGAEVIKVEPPVGDPTRHLPPFVEGSGGGAGAIFCALNRGKQSVVLDLKDQDDVARYKQLARTARIVVDGYRSGVATRLGVGFDALSQDREDLLYVALSGFGPEGPMAGQPGHDNTYQAWMGALDTEEPRLPNLPAADFTGGLWAALLASAHLGTPGNHRLEASLAGALKAPLLFDHVHALAGEQPNPIRQGLPGYEVYACGDGKLLAIGALEPHFWQSLGLVVGDGELTELGHPADPQPEAKTRLADHLAKEPRATWLERFEEAGVPCGPVRTPEEALQDPVTGGTWDPPGVASAGDLTGAPALGEHTEAVVSGLSTPP